MSKLASQTIELFRAGDHGVKGTFTEADLDQIVANYNPAAHEAPVVIGHPETNAPAYGWVKSLARMGKTLVGQFGQVQPAFEEMVENGAFKKRSVALYKDERGWSLRHVGFLGAQPPEIKGLADCSFAVSSSNAVEIAFEESGMAEESKSIRQQVQEFFAERFGAASTSATFSEADAKRIAAEAVAAAITPLQAKLDAQQATFAERDTQLATAETRARGAAAVTQLKAKGRWVPAFDKLGLPVVFAELAKTTVTIEFGEGASKKTATPLDTLVAFMEQLPAIVPNAPVYTGQAVKVTPDDKNKAGINDSARVQADPNSIALRNAARERAATAKISYSQALDQVAGEHPELTIPGGAASGAV